MYVQKPYHRTWTYQPDKMSHISLCVRVMYHLEIKQVQVSFCDPPPPPLWEHGESVRGPPHHTAPYIQAGWCLTSTVLLFSQCQTVMMTFSSGIPDNTCHVSSHTSAAPLFSQIRPLILTTVWKAAVIPRPLSVNITDRSDLRHRCYCSLTRITKKLHQGQRTLTRKWVSVNKSIGSFPSFSLQFPVHARKNCFELHPTLTGITVLFAFACLLIRLSIIVLKESALFHIKLLKSQSQT